MTPSVPRARDIFLEAIEIGSPEQRAAFLDTACAGERELRRRVEALLAAHERPESLLDHAAAAVPLEAPPSLAHAGRDPSRPEESPGNVIGPYTLIERIGEGGMGVVFLAEQAEPLRRRVALKVIKPGMDSEEVLARFEAERQALALMDHPHIAKVLNAGTSPLGRPYFVMDLVEGVPITRYCDEARLTPRQRLELFLPVCQAIQHAHQKGIIHRDIKPSNVLVILFDGQPVPKVIDFGVAKAIDQRLAERTLSTRFGVIVGTPEYMSPEQAAPSGQDIDTRSDVYGLGVLLYELLTGSTPLDRARLREVALEELLRRVREEEPPRPSARLSGTNERLPSVAAQRGTEPVRLARIIRGELDWVVMKALEKDRARRYETASAFSADVQRYLDGDPVEAGPPSRVYRLRKLARKHRAALAVLAGFAAVLVAATAVSTGQAVRATRAEDLALRRLGEVEQANTATTAALKQSGEAREQAEAVSKFLTEAFRSPDPGQDGLQIKVVDVLDRAVQNLDKEFTGKLDTKGALLDALGETYLGIGLYDRAVATLEKSLAVREAVLDPHHADTLLSRNNLGMAYQLAGRDAEAVKILQGTHMLQTEKLGPDHPDTLATGNNLAQAYVVAGRYAEAIALHKEALRFNTAQVGPDHPLTVNSRNQLASAYRRAGRYAEAIAMHEEALRLREARFGPNNPGTLISRSDLAEDHLAAGRLAEAIKIYEETLKLMTPKLGRDHPTTLGTRNGVAAAYHRAGRYAEAVAMHEETLKLATAKLGADHPNTLISRANLASAYLSVGRRPEAVKMLEETLELMTAKHGPDHPYVLTTTNTLASAYESLGRWAEAGSRRREALARRRKTIEPDSPLLAGDLAALGDNLLKQAKWTEAETVLSECLKIRVAKLPDDWSRFGTMSLLGGALLEQGQYAEAEPLIIQGYEGMKAREATIPAPARPRFAEAAARVVRLYEARGKPDQAAAWKAKLGLSDLPTSVFAPR